MTRTVLRVGVLAIAAGAAFVAGRVTSAPHRRGLTSLDGGAASDPGAPSPPPPWAAHGFREGETCEDVFQDPG